MDAPTYRDVKHHDKCYLGCIEISLWAYLFGGFNPGLGLSLGIGGRAGGCWCPLAEVGSSIKKLERWLLQMYCSYAQSTLRRLSKIRICFSTYDGMHTRCFSYGDHLSSNYLNQETDSGAKGPVNKSVLSTKEQSRFLSVVLECSGTSIIMFPTHGL